jgi:hypothetical protein
VWERDGLPSEEKPRHTSQERRQSEHGRVVMSSRETLSDILKPLKRTMEAMKSHQQPHLVWTRRVLTHRLTVLVIRSLGQESSKRIQSGTHGEKGETLTILVRSSSGSNWMVLCEDKTEEFEFK